MAINGVKVQRITSNFKTGELIREEENLLPTFKEAYEFFDKQRRMDKELHALAVRQEKSRTKNLVIAEEFVETFPCIYYGRINDIEVRCTIKGIVNLALEEYLLKKEGKDSNVQSQKTTED